MILEIFIEIEKKVNSKYFPKTKCVALRIYVILDFAHRLVL